MTIALVAVTVIALLLAGQAFVNRWRRAEEQTVECECGKLLAESKAHIVVDAGPTGNPDLDRLSAGAGTGLKAEFCDRHCPGNCTTPNKRHVKSNG